MKISAREGAVPLAETETRAPQDGAVTVSGCLPSKRDPRLQRSACRPYTSFIFIASNTASWLAKLYSGEMRLPLPALIVCLCSACLCNAAFAQDRRSVRDVTDFVRSAIQLKEADGDVAKALHKLALTESLDERTIFQLQSQGAGPKTVAELRRLMEAARALPKPAAPAASVKPELPPPPSAEDQKRVIEAARETALHYTEGLPDFLCTQAIRRYVDTDGKESWRLIDRLVVRLGYAERREDYKLISRNDRPTDQDYQALSGTTSAGEFGSMLHEIFNPQSHAEFHWDREVTLHDRPVHVFSYRVAPGDASYQLSYGTDPQHRQHVTAGFHGLVYVDRDTSQVAKCVLEADNIPADFPVQRAVTTVDYDLAEVGGKPYLLPLRADLRLGTAGQMTRNDVQFVNYRKFSADATLSFDTPAPLPEEKTKEKKPIR
jgi:hypothetical protein